MKENDTHTPFHEALKYAVASHITAYYELLAFLGRENAYDEAAPLKFMLASLTGYYSRLWQIRTADEARALAAHFASSTGFRHDLTDYLFMSFAYAMNLISEAPVLPSSDAETESDSRNASTVQEDVPPYGDGMQCTPEGEKVAADGGEIQAWNSRWPEDKKKSTLTSRIEVVRENERRLGVKVITVCCNAVTEHNFTLAADLHRIEPGATGALWYAAFDSEEYILSSGILGTICLDDVSQSPRSLLIPVPPSKVSSIRLYWD